MILSKDKRQQDSEKKRALTFAIYRNIETLKNSMIYVKINKTKFMI